jgi:hypothetical protein
MGRFPRFLGTRAVLRLPAALPAALRCLRLAVPRLGSAFAPRLGEPICLGLGLGQPATLPARSRGDNRVSQVPGRPPCAHAPLSDPGGSSLPGHSDNALLPSANPMTSASTIYELTGLYHAACALPVYASQWRLPDPHATLGSGWWPAFAGRDSTPAGTLQTVSKTVASTSLPPSPSLAWRNGLFMNVRSEAA